MSAFDTSLYIHINFWTDLPVLDSWDYEQQRYVEIRRKLRHGLSYEIYLKAGSLFPLPLYQNVNANIAPPWRRSRRHTYGILDGNRTRTLKKTNQFHDPIRPISNYMSRCIILVFDNKKQRPTFICVDAYQWNLKVVNCWNVPRTKKTFSTTVLSISRERSVFTNVDTRLSGRFEIYVGRRCNKKPLFARFRVTIVRIRLRCFRQTQLLCSPLDGTVVPVMRIDAIRHRSNTFEKDERKKKRNRSNKRLVSFKTIV